MIFSIVLGVLVVLILGGAAIRMLVVKVGGVNPIVYWVITIIVIAIVAYFGIKWFHGRSPGSAGTSYEVWTFHWSLPPGEYSRSRNEETLRVRIVENTSESLWFDAMYNYQGRTETCRHQLNKCGGDKRMVGSWTQDRPEDGGTIYLDKVGEQWVGQSTDKAGNRYPCSLNRTIVSKP